MPSISSKALDAATSIPTSALPPEQDGGWMYVNIPERDLTDYPFSGIGINFQFYGNTKNNNGNKKCDCKDYPNCQSTGTHKVPVEIGQEINRRLDIARKQEIKLFSAKVNLQALRELGASPNNNSAATQEFLAEQSKL